MGVISGGPGLPDSPRDPLRKCGAGRSSASRGGTAPTPVGHLSCVFFVAFYVDPPDYCGEVESRRLVPAWEPGAAGRAPHVDSVGCGAADTVVTGSPGSGAQRSAEGPGAVGGVIGPVRGGSTALGRALAPDRLDEGSPIAAMGAVGPFRGSTGAAGSGPFTGLMENKKSLRALGRAKSHPADVSQPQPPPLTGEPGRNVLRIATINDGKLSDSRSLFLSGWMQDAKVDVSLVSEAAHCGKRELLTEEAHEWAQPLMQGKGGAGFLYRHELLKGKILLTQDGSFHAVLSWCRFISTPLVV